MNQLQSLKAKTHTIQNSVKIRWLIAASFLAIPLSVFLFLIFLPFISYEVGDPPTLLSILLNLLLVVFVIFYNQLCIILSTALFFSLLITHTKMPAWKYLLLLACYAYPALILGFFFEFDPQNLTAYFSFGFEVLSWQVEDFWEILQSLFLH